MGATVASAWGEGWVGEMLYSYLFIIYSLMVFPYFRIKVLVNFLRIKRMEGSQWHVPNISNTELIVVTIYKAIDTRVFHIILNYIFIPLFWPSLEKNFCLQMEDITFTPH